MAVGASLVCSVENTRCPVRAACSAISAASRRLSARRLPDTPVLAVPDVADQAELTSATAKSLLQCMKKLRRLQARCTTCSHAAYCPTMDAWAASIHAALDELYIERSKALPPRPPEKYRCHAANASRCRHQRASA